VSIHRHPAGSPVGGRFAETQKSDPECDLTADRSRCGHCGQFAGGVHRCPAPRLIPLSKQTRAVLGAVESVGGKPYLVGGCVRDALLFTDSKDIDIEVYGRSLDELEVALTDAGFRVDAVGKHFGVLKVSRGGEEIDVSVPRRDSKIGQGHRGFDVEVDHSLTETEATARRDFTINALMWDPRTGELVDCHGGIADLHARVLRHTSDAFDEDPLRVLRGVQFAGRFDLTMHPDTVALCRSLSDSYGEIPVERVWGEWAKIAGKSTHPGRSLDLLRATGWDRHHPELVAIEDVPQDPKWHPEGPVHVHVGETADAAARIAVRDGLSDDDRQLLVFAAIAHDFGKATHTQVHESGKITSHGHAEAGVEPTERFLRGIGAPSKIIDQVTPLVAEHMCAATQDGPTPRSVRRLARRLGSVPIEMWAKVVEADNMGRGVGSHPGPAGEWVCLARDIAVDRSPAPPLLTGKDLIDAGMKPGPNFKTILAAAQEAQDDGAFGDRDGALAWFRERHSA
jgi:tRNA nucleotidyltransferase (CCA-adding enzyme)